jgi:hypothetical protein
MVQPIDKLLSWKNLMLMTMAFTFILAPLGTPPLIAMGIAAISFALWHIDKDVANPNNIAKRKVAFIFSLCLGCAFGLGSAPYVIPGATKLGMLLFPVCLSFFINYGTVLGWWTFTGGFVTLLLSVIPAMAIGRNPGINMLISFIVSSAVYAWLVADNKNKKEPWMVWQSAYIGLMVGSAIDFIMGSPRGNMDLLQNIIEFYQSGGQISSFAGSIIGTADVPMGIIWLVYFITWILSFIPGALPYGWDTLFKVK